MENSILLNSETYLDHDKLPMLVDLVDEYTKQDLSKFWVDVGEHNVGRSINWKSVIVYDVDNTWPISNELADHAKNIINFANTIPGINRITINLLNEYSFMPIHIDDETRPEYDDSSKYYNIILSVNSVGWSIVDYKVIKNEKYQSLIFNSQVPHGAMNDILETRITIYLIVEKSRFNVNT